MAPTGLFMQKANDMILIDKFPSFKADGFNMDTYNNVFKQSNVIINASSADVAYPEHWGCLSVKTASGGSEVYKISDRYYAVNDDSFFICNNGEYYSSYIAARQPVESFTLNFSDNFVKRVKGSLNTDVHLLDQPDFMVASGEFVQKLYPHGGELSRAILGIKYLVKNFDENKGRIAEDYYSVLQNLFLSQQHIIDEIKQVKAVKLSTQKELYKRLHYAKDYIESCYTEDITLDKLAQISCLNSGHLLRKFKQYFNCSPYQLLIKKRMEAAAALLLTDTLTVTEICFQTGYADVSSFCRLFKKTHLMSPERYRETNKKIVVFCTCGV